VTNGQKCTTAACYTPNAATQSCACPSGFTSLQIQMLDERACPNNNPPYGWSGLNVCYAGAFTAASDFGGVYHTDGTTCFVGNPMAPGNGCACPAGSQAIELTVDGSCYVATTVGVCWNGSAPLKTFGGAYETGTATLGGGDTCLVKNPATSACSCPAGTSAVAFATVSGRGFGSCSGTGANPASLYFCGTP
jgi:hypothetical protein